MPYQSNFTNVQENVPCPKTARFHHVQRTLCDPATDAQGEGRTDGTRGGGEIGGAVQIVLQLGSVSKPPVYRQVAGNRRRIWCENQINSSRKIISEKFADFANTLLTFAYFANILIRVTLEVRKHGQYDKTFSRFSAAPSVTTCD